MIKILVVDDSALMRRLLTQIFTAAGDFTVVTARNGAEALAMLHDVAPDVMTLDIAMPGMDGIEVLGRLLDIERGLPIILNTAYSSYKEDFMTWAAESYVTKSGDLRELRGKIREALVKRGVESPDTPDEETPSPS